MFSRFFIDRPIFSCVLSIIILILGGLAYFRLPVELYPKIVPPQVVVNASYSGADAKTMAQSVAVPLEEQINGVENMLCMTTTCANGSVSIAIQFEIGTNVDDALVLVQNRVSLATPKLPGIVRQNGVTVRKSQTDNLMSLVFLSPTGEYNQTYISNFLWLKIRDVLLRVPGVADLTMFGEKSYSMRVWLDPTRMAARNLSVTDVSRAIEEQNIQVAAGKIGQPPLDDPVAFQFTVRTKGQLTSIEEFGNIVVRTEENGRVTRLKDVASVDLSAVSTDVTCYYVGREAVGLSIYLLPDANALATSKLVKAKMKELERIFPPGISWEVSYDTTPYIEESVYEVKKTLIEAVLLVAFVVILFLQSWRAALIPLLAVPISLIGTFSFMYALGFSLNTLSLFGLVLAIGIVVDDAIVVVESIEHHMESGLAPKEAAYKAMSEISGALVAIALVLSSVFVPASCLTGILGKFFREFALTIAVSTLISAFVSLTLSPALSAILLTPKGARRDLLTFLLDITVGWIFRLFNCFFKWSTKIYVGLVRRFLRLAVIVLLLYGGLLLLTWKIFNEVPRGFIPFQDKGYLRVDVLLPDASSVFRTRELMRKLYNVAINTDGVDHFTGYEGYSSSLGSVSNAGYMFVVLEPYQERMKKGLTDLDIQNRLKAKFDEFREGKINIFRPPPVNGVGTGGISLQIQDLGDNELTFLQKAGDDVVAAALESRQFAAFQNSFRGAVPELYLNIDRTKAKSLNVPLTEIFRSLNIYFGSLYVNDLAYLGRNYQVKLQADARYRSRPEQIYKVHVKNDYGQMVPLGSFLKVEQSSGPLKITRYNMYPASTLQGQSFPGVSSAQAMDKLEKIMKEKLPSSMGYEWTNLSMLEKRAGNTAIYVFAFAVLMVFLLLAALYESWSLPFAVILVVPMCLLCSIAGVQFANLDMNIFTQLGFIVLVGLASKNAILIVEFAKTKQASGADGREATLEACRLRLRPIIMTSLAFILGVVPLIISRGAGWEMRNTLGVAVFSGMLGVTLFGIFLTPVFYYVIQKCFQRKK